ncbi:MAG TPA: peptidoglycan-binding domain-containing protein [Polyangia bacterium]|jgi:Putative peptidoglycan binding domain|nr:peptidoglycan-binding domain-containing protein [Polyangia bacterium]
MASYRVGSAGPEVLEIQRRLARLGHYAGPLDATFGGGTDAAVVSFQRSLGLDTDGVVGDRTWRALFGSDAAPAPAVTRQPLPDRCLALTGAIETGAAPPDCFAAVTGDFDGQGISFGAIRLTLGSGTLGEFLRALDAGEPACIDDVFHENAGVLRAVLRAPIAEQLTWARSIQHSALRQLDEPWNGMFRALGRRPECRALQVAFADRRFQAAQALCREYSLWSERGVALMFDIVVQNGPIGPLVQAQIQRDCETMNGLDRDALELARMRSIARRRSAVCKPELAGDVLARKMIIADGVGRLHGRSYDLAEDYGIRLFDVVLTS